MKTVDDTRLHQLRVLVEAGIATSSELSLDALLQRIVDSRLAAHGRPYAALGVIDRSGRSLERFLTTGISDEEHAAIGELPRGRGILGVLIRDAKTLRLRDIADDPRSVGFPRHHPPMRTFLGVPIVLRGTAFGTLYLTEKAGGAVFDVKIEDPGLYPFVSHPFAHVDLGQVGLLKVGNPKGTTTH